MTLSPLPPQLAGQPVIFTLPVQWGDQDMFGHVNNVVYFRWFESARIEYFVRGGLPERSAVQPIGPILAAINCNYRRQLRYPDTIHISASVVKFGRTSLMMDHRIFSELQQAIVADGTSTVVMFDYAAQKSTPIPDELRAKIEKIEGRTIA